MIVLSEMETEGVDESWRVQVARNAIRRQLARMRLPPWLSSPDAEQEAMVRWIRRVAQEGAVENADVYCVAIARNVVRSAWRDWHRRRERALGEAEALLLPDRHEPSEDEGQLVEATLRAALLEMVGDRCADLFIVVRFHRLPPRDAAQILGLSPRASQACLKRISRLLSNREAVQRLVRRLAEAGFNLPFPSLPFPSKTENMNRYLLGLVAFLIAAATPVRATMARELGEVCSRPCVSSLPSYTLYTGEVNAITYNASGEAVSFTLGPPANTKFDISAPNSTLTEQLQRFLDGDTTVTVDDKDADGKFNGDDTITEAG
jgi:DNA-directed RNA polymerase specialized sigma24 family protein